MGAVGRGKLARGERGEEVVKLLRWLYLMRRMRSTWHAAVCGTEVHGMSLGHEGGGGGSRIGA